MVDFNQAIKWIKEGKKVRRKEFHSDCWWSHEYGEIFCNMSANNPKNISANIDNFIATDWEIYCEEHEWVSLGEFIPNGGGRVKMICNNCGIEKPRDELKTLKDLKPYMQGTSLAEFDWMKDKVKQEAIKDIKRLEKQIENSPKKTPIIAEGIIDYIKWKNNITEEELKDKEEKLSNCCNAPFIEDSDVCSDCKEHAGEIK